MMTQTAEPGRAEAQTQALTLSRRDDGIGVVTIDCPGLRQNILGRELINEASRMLDELARDHSLRGVIFISGKPDSFIAGADIGMIRDCESAEEATALSHIGQRIFERLATFHVPVVAAIHGACLGGGLELALACHARVGTDADTTRLGLPEVQLGLLPGGGGTQRLPRLIGLPAALNLLLTGRRIDARRARRLGLVDDVVPVTILLEAAVAQIQTAPRSHAGHRPGAGAMGRVLRWAIDGNPLGRGVVLRQARRGVRAKTGGHYPAPERILECVAEGLGAGLPAGYEAEARAFGELAMTPEARALGGIYLATTAMKKETGVADRAVTPRPVHRVGVLGAGLMGAGITLVTIDRARLPVRLKEVQAASLSRGMKHIADGIASRRRRRALSTFEADLARRRVTPTLDFSGFAGLDLVIEAVFEDLELKHRMVRDVEAHCHQDTIFATNTSALPIRRVAEGAARPHNVIGMHYFSPVEKMPLLEVIAHEETAPEVIATVVALGRRQGKTPIVVGDGAGFYVNRILAPYINEAVHLLGEGVAIDHIDRALEGFGFPMGPFRLLDQVGIDISAHVAPILYQAYGERMRPNEISRRMIDAGRLGRKSGRGFYRHDGRRSGRAVDASVYPLLGVKPQNAVPESEIRDRTVTMMLNEAVRCLDEGVLRSARDGDIGAVFGIGFPPFLGGPFRYLDRIGADAAVRRLQRFQASHGERFAPAGRLLAMAGDDARFHDRD